VRHGPVCSRSWRPSLPRSSIRIFGSLTHCARERFYRRHPADRVRWMRVVVGFFDEPAVIVTAFIQRKNPDA
jgi:hypothetical protein